MKVGFINYSNCYPFLKEFQDHPVGKIELVIEPPGVLNAMLRKGELDLSAVSTFEYLENASDYVLLPEVCINSKGYVRSVLLFSRVPMEELNGKEVILTRKSATSVNLLKIIFNEKSITPQTMRTFDAAAEIEESDAVLLIGDDALEFDSSSHPHVYDLAHEWTQLTSMPVVFAVWAARRESLDRNAKLIDAIMMNLRRAKERTLHEMSVLVDAATKAYPHLNVDFDEYFRGLDFDLSPECQESILLYQSKLVDLKCLNLACELEYGLS